MNNPVQQAIRTIVRQELQSLFNLNTPTTTPRRRIRTRARNTSGAIRKRNRRTGVGKGMVSNRSTDKRLKINREA